MSTIAGKLCLEFMLINDKSMAKFKDSVQVRSQGVTTDKGKNQILQDFYGLAFFGSLR